MSKIIDGKAIANSLLAEIKSEVDSFTRPPKLVIIKVGMNSASEIYVKVKRRACEQVGILCEVVELLTSVSELEITNKIKELNADSSVSGIIVQLPLPNDLDTDNILNSISNEKDVDGLTSDSKFTPATANAVVRLLKEQKLDFKGKRAVVIGRSKLVGAPTAKLLAELGCDVVVCHSQTKDVKAETLQADILVVAVGKKNLVSKDMIKTGAIVIDVGINRFDGKIYGDVSEDAIEVAGAITPVPGGVGPMTVACLLENVLLSAKDTLPSRRL